MPFRILPTQLLVSAALSVLLAMPCAEGANYQLGNFYGGDFELRDHNGERFRLRDMRGKVVLIEFGFTSCADICPVTLAKLGMALRELGPLGERVQPVFISVDAKRDTPAVLRGYTTYFHPAILGLTGTQSEVEAVARLYRTPVRVRPADESGFYVVDHGSRIFFVDTTGMLANTLPADSSPERIAQEVRSLLDQ
jgi:protein SCO1/2